MKLLLVFISFILSPEAFAHEGEKHQSEDIRVLQSYDLSGSFKAYIVAREQGHIIGQNFQVELRVNCSHDDIDVKELKVLDSFSVCDLDPKSLKMNLSKNAVAMKTKAADMKAYYDQVDKGDQLPEVQCGKKTQIKKFSMSKFCQ